jgi:hypothetical protein
MPASGVSRIVDVPWIAPQKGPKPHLAQAKQFLTPMPSDPVPAHFLIFLD